MDINEMESYSFELMDYQRALRDPINRLRKELDAADKVADARGQIAASEFLLAGLRECVTRLENALAAPRPVRPE